MGSRPESPNFVQAWIKDLSEEVNERWYNIIPSWLIACFVPSATCAYYLSPNFWNEHHGIAGNATVVFSAFLTLNGIIVALSWSAFGKIYEMIGEGNFSKFLHDEGALEPFLFLVRYVHVFQMVALVVSGFALVAAQFDQFPIAGQRVSFAVAFGFGAYAIKQASTAVGVMQDLVRYKAIYEAAQPQLQRNGLKVV